MNFSTECPVLAEESCSDLPPFLATSDTAAPSCHASATPPLLCHRTGPPPDTRTARRPVQIEPTVIRLNKVKIYLIMIKYFSADEKYFILCLIYNKY